MEQDLTQETVFFLLNYKNASFNKIHTLNPVQSDGGPAAVVNGKIFIYPSNAYSSLFSGITGKKEMSFKQLWKVCV